MSAPVAKSIAILALTRWLLLPCGVALLIPLITRFLPSSASSFAWAVDLAAHWQSMYAALWLLLCLIAATQTPQWLLLTPFALIPLATASAALPRHDGGAPAIVVVAANVHVGNRDPSPLADWLKIQQADLVVLSELSEPYARALTQALGDQYPYRELHPKNSPFGIGIVSGVPLRNIDMTEDSDGVRKLIAEVTVDGRSARIVAIHPMPPLAPEWHRKRNETLSNVVRGAADTPTIAAGDVNATPWSSAFFGAERSGLRRATALTPTWPRSGRGIVGIPIDHILATSHWRRGDSSRGPDIGSDHSPVVASLHWAEGRDSGRDGAP
jgi:endonuclease/exonuclease/phosphatase (EEP) superfamily protein YafD